MCFLLAAKTQCVNFSDLLWYFWSVENYYKAENGENEKKSALKMCYLEKGVKRSSHYGTTLAITESNFFQFFWRVGANRLVCDSWKGGGGGDACPAHRTWRIFYIYVIQAVLTNIEDQPHRTWRIFYTDVLILLVSRSVYFCWTILYSTCGDTQLLAWNNITACYSPSSTRDNHVRPIRCH